MQVLARTRHDDPHIWRLLGNLPSAGFVEVNLSFPGSLLECDRASGADGRVPPLRVLEPLDVVEGICARLFPCPISFSPDPSGSQRREEALHPMPLQAAMQRRARQMWDRWLQGIEAIIRRQQSMPTEGHRHRFLVRAQNGRAGSFGPVL